MDAGLEPGRSDAMGVGQPASPSPSEPCRDELGPSLARLSCAGDRILVAHPIELHPERAIPAEPTGSVLRAVAELLHDRPDLQLVRIEVYSGRQVDDATAARAEIAEAQRRAGALLELLWHRHRISAERLEAVGFSHDPAVGSQPRWPVVLRVLQRRP